MLRSETLPRHRGPAPQASHPMRPAFLTPLAPLLSARLLAARSSSRCAATMSASRYAPVLLLLALAFALLPRHRALTPASPVSLSASALPPPSGEYVLAFSSVPDTGVARALSDALVGARLAACVATLPGVTSTYRWQGKVETAQELMLVIKTRAEVMDGVQEMVRKLHPYEVPELVAVPISHGLPDYLKWMTDETTALPGAASGVSGGGGGADSA
jgi:periplasmic divalent cation tolerance protein